MAEMWYYTCEGKQMEPVTAAELKQRAARGLLKPTDMVWKEGMPAWIRAGRAPELFAENGRITVQPPPLLTPGKKDSSPEDPRPKDQDDEPRRQRRRDPDDYDEDDEEVWRRRRRARQNTGMNFGLKIGLLVGGSLLGLILLLVIIIAAVRSANNARAQLQQAGQFNINPPVIINPPVFNPPNQGLRVNHPPVYRGPLDVVPEGLIITDKLSTTDSRDDVMRSFCKVFTVKMVAGKTYTIRHNSINNNNNKNNIFDPFLRIEDSNFMQLAMDDDGGGFLNALVVFRPPQTGVYRVIATSLHGTTGNFTLQINQD